jgi:hypothetical protein
MSLCFLEPNNQEAAYFHTSNGNDGWIRLNTAHWGTESNTQYFGFGSGERPLCIEREAIRLPHSTAFAVGDCVSIEPIARTIDFRANRMTLDAPIHCPKTLAVAECAILESVHTRLIPSQQLTLDAPIVTLGNQCIVSKMDGFTCDTPSTFRAPFTTSNATIHQSLTLLPSSQFQCDQATVRTLSLNTLYLPPCATLTSFADLDIQSDAFRCGLTKGRFQIDAQTPIELNAPLQLNRTLRMGSNAAEFSENGDWTTQGTLRLTHPTVTHTIRGSLEHHGASLTVSQATPIFQKGVTIHQSCKIGQPHQTAEMIVYGTTHLSKSFYSHDCAYFDKTVRMNADVVFSPSSVATRHQPVITVPKGSLALHDGRLHVNVAPNATATATLVVQGDSALGGHTDIRASLTVGQGMTVGGALDVKGGLTCHNEVSLLAPLTVAAPTEFKDTVAFQRPVQLGSGADLTLEGGRMTVNGTLQASSIQTAPNGGNLDVGGAVRIPNGTLQLRNRRYGIHEPIAPPHERWIRCLVIPSHRGLHHFYVKLQGRIYTSKDTKSFAIELGGTTASPSLKHCVVHGNLGAQVDSLFNVTFYRHHATQDLHAYLEFHRRAEMGLELDIDVGAAGRKDLYTWESTTPPPAHEWTVWWKPLATPDEAIVGDSHTQMTKLGIGESNPLYMLDVRPDARFQSKLYQPFPSDVLQILGLPTNTPYVPITDILTWLVRRKGSTT